jgi:hypothetical protein
MEPCHIMQIFGTDTEFHKRTPNCVTKFGLNSKTSARNREGLHGGVEPKFELGDLEAQQMFSRSLKRQTNPGKLD